MTTYRLTYSNGVEVDIQALYMRDDGITTTLYRDDSSIAYSATDCEIVCCVPIDEPIDTLDVRETKGGVVLVDEYGMAIAAYRNYV